MKWAIIALCLAVLVGDSVLAAPPARFRPVITKATATVTLRVIENKAAKKAAAADEELEPAPQPDDDSEDAPSPDDSDPPAPLPNDEPTESSEEISIEVEFPQPEESPESGEVATAENEDKVAEETDEDEYLEEAPQPEEDFSDEVVEVETAAEEETSEEEALSEEPVAEESTAEDEAPIPTEDEVSATLEEDEPADEGPKGESPSLDTLPEMEDEAEIPYDGHDDDEPKKLPDAEKVEKGKSEPNPDFDGLTPVAALRMRVMPAGKEFPQDLAGKRFEREGMIHASYVTNRPWAPMYFSWEATALCHSALYFEDPNLERLGYSYGVFQPAVSAAHFFGTIPALPYLLAAHPQKECVYTLGQYRAGSHAPLSFVYPRIDPKAALFQGAVVAGLILLIP